MFSINLQLSLYVANEHSKEPERAAETPAPIPAPENSPLDKVKRPTEKKRSRERER
jgi:hypothetical protein